MHAPEIQKRLYDLVPWLLGNKALWYERPFAQDHLSWTAQEPELVDWLDSLDLDSVELLESDPWAIDAVPARFHALRTKAQALCVLPSISGPQLSPPSYARWKIPHRKLEQSLALGSLALPWLRGPDATLLEWCAGKAHLARVCVASCGCHAIAVERDAGVVKAGESLHRRAGVDVRYKVADVLQAPEVDGFSGVQAALSLHACGVLTDVLSKQVNAQSIPVQVSAFCCIHFTGQREKPHELRSRTARTLPLRLDQVGLRLALTDESCAAERHKRQRRQEMIWRHGARRELLNRGAELPWASLGNLPTNVKRLNYSEFVRTLCAEYKVQIPASWDAEESRLAAELSVLKARRRGLVRSIFRRPLECWHVFDRALWAAESGRRVVLGTFAPQSCTPRNIALLSASADKAKAFSELRIAR